MKKYHVHVYEVISKAEADISAFTEVEARQKAIKAYEEGTLKKGESDCSCIAIEFDITEEKNNG